MSASSPHSMYENEHAEFLFAKVLAPHVSRLPVEQDRLDACHHLARLVEQYEAQRETTQKWYDEAHEQRRRANATETKIAAQNLALGDLHEQLQVAQRERDEIGVALGEPCAECGHMDWRSDGYLDNLLHRREDDHTRLKEQLQTAQKEIESLEGIERDRDMHADKATAYQAEYRDLKEQYAAAQAENRMWRKIHDIDPDVPMLIPSEDEVPPEAVEMGRKLMEHYRPHERNLREQLEALAQERDEWRDAARGHEDNYRASVEQFLALRAAVENELTYPLHERDWKPLRDAFGESRASGGYS